MQCIGLKHLMGPLWLFFALKILKNISYIWYLYSRGHNSGSLKMKSNCSGSICSSWNRHPVIYVIWLNIDFIGLQHFFDTGFWQDAMFFNVWNYWCSNEEILWNKLQFSYWHCIFQVNIFPFNPSNNRKIYSSSRRISFKFFTK